MTDRYEKIRKALAMGPTPGPWELRDGRTDTVENAQGYPVCTVNYHPDERYGHGTRAAYIAACDPDTIRELLDERDALLDALRQIAEWHARICSMLAEQHKNDPVLFAALTDATAIIRDLMREWLGDKA